MHFGALACLKANSVKDRQATIPGLKGTGIAVEKRILNVMIYEDSDSWLAVWVAKVFGMKMS